MNDQTIEIPFGAKDSELTHWECTIPEGMEAEIKDDKVIIKKKDSDDERIRKDIVDFIKSHTDEFEKSTDCWDMLAWLEKQKEGNLVERKYVQEAYKKGLDWGLKQKELKPADWSEEDERALNDAIVALSMYAYGEIPYILPS